MLHTLDRGKSLSLWCGEYTAPHALSFDITTNSGYNQTVL